MISYVPAFIEVGQSAPLLLLLSLQYFLFAFRVNIMDEKLISCAELD